MLIPELNMSVVGKCNLNCKNCAHLACRTEYAQWHLSISALEKFIISCHDSDYIIETLNINAIGEPLCWENLLEGLPLLHQSKIAKCINLVTNGLLFLQDTALLTTVLNYVDKTSISLYEFLDDEKKIHIRELLTHNKVRIFERHYFGRRIASIDETYSIPCKCMCGLTFTDNRISICGAPGHDAFKLCNLPYPDIFQILSVPVKKDWYLEVSKLIKDYQGKMVLCMHCFNNSNKYFYQQRDRVASL